MSRETSQASIDTLLDAFARAYEAKAPFREDRALLEELQREARPVLEALLQSITLALPLDQAHEACALVTLLARRAAWLCATPTALVGMVDALLSACESVSACDPSFAWRLRVLAFEGYSAGRDERLAADHAQMLRDSQVLTLLAPRCLCAFFSGKHEPERLSPVLDELGRLALRHDAAACLVDLSRLDLTSEDLVRVVFDGVATLSSLGVVPVLFAPGPEASAQVARFASVVPMAVFPEHFAEAVHMALAAAGHELKPRRRWGKDLFTRGKSSGTRG